jgi:mono/diheme cytochrome c family protein
VSRDRPTVLRLLLFVPIMLVAGSLAAQDAASGSGARSNHWTIPPTAATEHSPLALTAQVLASGEALYATHCVRCHGVAGRNDGPDSDPAYVNADLTDAERIEINPDGVVFYKIWNGRGGLIPHERMPGFGFSGVLSKSDVWALVAYVQTLRHAKRD